MFNIPALIFPLFFFLKQKPLGRYTAVLNLPETKLWNF